MINSQLTGACFPNGNVETYIFSPLSAGVLLSDNPCHGCHSASARISVQQALPALIPAPLRLLDLTSSYFEVHGSPYVGLKVGSQP